MASICGRDRAQDAWQVVVEAVVQHRMLTARVVVVCRVGRTWAKLAFDRAKVGGVLPYAADGTFFRAWFVRVCASLARAAAAFVMILPGEARPRRHGGRLAFNVRLVLARTICLRISIASGP